MYSRMWCACVGRCLVHLRICCDSWVRRDLGIVGITCWGIYGRRVWGAGWCWWGDGPDCPSGCGLVVTLGALLSVFKIMDTEVMIGDRVLRGGVERLKWGHRVCIKQRRSWLIALSAWKGRSSGKLELEGGKEKKEGKTKRRKLFTAWVLVPLESQSAAISIVRGLYRAEWGPTTTAFELPLVFFHLE